jgi:hypothetical protein
LEKKAARLRANNAKEISSRSTEIRNKNPQYPTINVPYRPSSMLLRSSLLLLRYTPSFRLAIAEDFEQEMAAVGERNDALNRGKKKNKKPV